MGKRPSKQAESKKTALEFKELLLANGLVSSTPGPSGNLLVGFYEEGRGTFFVPCNPIDRDSLFNIGFVTTVIRSLAGPKAYLIPVHGKVQLTMPGSGGSSGDTCFDAMENYLRWRVDWPSKDASPVNMSGKPDQDPTGDAPAVDASTASG